MKLTALTYSVSAQIDGQWRKLEMSVDVEEGESSRVVFNKLQYQTHNLLGIEVPELIEPVSTQSAVEPEPEPEPVPAPKAKPKVKAIVEGPAEAPSDDSDIPW